MSKDEVLNLWRKRPFEPFRIVTVAGEAIDVMHPNLMIVSGNLITIGTPDPDHPPPAADQLIWLEFEDIVRADPLDSVAHR